LLSASEVNHLRKCSTMNPIFWCGMVSTILRDDELGKDTVALIEKHKTIPPLRKTLLIGIMLVKFPTLDYNYVITIFDGVSRLLD
jgi:hypothetical protein